MNTAELKALFATHPQTEAEKEVRSWLKSCSHVFTADWSPCEVAHMAISVGLDIVAVLSVMSHWQDAMAGSRFENRAAMQDFRLTHALQEFSRLKTELERVPELDLRPQWQELTDYQLGVR